MGNNDIYIYIYVYIGEDQPQTPCILELSWPEAVRYISVKVLYVCAMYVYTYIGRLRRARPALMNENDVVSWSI